MKQAFLAVAVANDTLHVPRRTSGQPGRKLLLIEVNECKETSAHGGCPAAAADLPRSKPLVVSAGPRDQEQLGSMFPKKPKTHD